VANSRGGKTEAQKRAAVIPLLLQLHQPRVHGGERESGVVWTQTKAAGTATRGHERVERERGKWTRLTMDSRSAPNV
jgi:hypothetical protein